MSVYLVCSRLLVAVFLRPNAEDLCAKGGAHQGQPRGGEGAHQVLEVQVPAVVVQLTGTAGGGRQNADCADCVSACCSPRWSGEVRERVRSGPGSPGQYFHKPGGSELLDSRWPLPPRPAGPLIVGPGRCPSRRLASVVECHRRGAGSSGDHGGFLVTQPWCRGPRLQE